MTDFSSEVTPPLFGQQLDAISGQLNNITDTIRFPPDFGIVGDGIADDTAAVQRALNWLGPGKTLFMPAKLKVSATVYIGNGTTTAVSTIANGSTIVWAGDPITVDGLINTGDPEYGAPDGGTRFIWAGAVGGTILQISGPIQGMRWVGTPITDGGCTSNGAPGAGVGIAAYSFSNCTFDGLVSVNCQANSTGIVMTTVNSTGISGNGNPVLSAGNRIGRVYSFHPYATNGICLSLDGYKIAGGGDFTVSWIGLIQCGICGTGGIGLDLGFVDDVLIGHIVNVVYGAVAGAYGIYLTGGATPFATPARVRILKASVGQGVSVGGGTSAQVVIDEYEMDDGATLPSGITGLVIRSICKTGAAIDQMAYPTSGKTQTRALGDGEGFYGRDNSGTHLLSLSRQGTAAHVAGFGDVELEASATSGPSTTKHFKVTTAGAGYPVGVGGVITQATDKATGVPLNTVCGAITLNNAALAAGAVVSFTLTNSTIAADDFVDVWLKSGNATAGTYRCWSEGNGSGSRIICLQNISGGSLSEAVVLGFGVNKRSVT